MFQATHHGGKYSPTRFFVVEAQATVHKSPPLTGAKIADQGVTHRTPETSPPPPPCARTRHARGPAVMAARLPSSAQSPSLESVGAAWTDPEPKDDNGQGCVAPRSRKRGFRPPDVRTIFSTSKQDSRVKQERGEGHVFGPGAVGAWCDVCCNYIPQGSLTCSGCKYTCHTECRDRVSLDCQPGVPSPTDASLSPLSQDQLNNNTQLTDVEKEKELRTQLSKEEIRQKIEQYNTLTTDHLKMTLSPSGVYTGFIKVQMELRRPVTVRGGQAGAGGVAGEEAFYLPRGATNTLHISSNNTVKQVIGALLNKFTVADNPAKYALYKRYRREEQVYVCKLAEGEQPLFLRLVAGPNSDTLSFVLREQQTGEVMWDAFSIPELRNFLRILEKEEQEQLDTINRRYDSYRQRLQEALRERPAPPKTF